MTMFGRGGRARLRAVSAVSAVLLAVGALLAPSPGAVAAAAEGPFELCGLSFRRRIHEVNQFDFQVSWGARFSCNVTMRYMKFRARVVRYGEDSHVLAYGNLVNLANARNEFSGGNSQFLHRPHLVVYVSADLGFPLPADPNNFAIGVTADPGSVNQGQSDCHRVGKTFVVHCEARSISFD